MWEKRQFVDLIAEGKEKWLGKLKRCVNFRFLLIAFPPKKIPETTENMIIQTLETYVFVDFNMGNQAQQLSLITGKNRT